MPEDTETTESNPDIKELREAAKRLPDLEERASKAEILERENAFLKAGVQTDTPLGKLLFKAYDGELTTDAIKAAADELGAASQPAAPPPPADTELAPGEDSAMDAANSMAPGATPPTEEPKTDPRSRAQEDYVNAINSGATNEQALGKAFHTLVQAAAAGDERVILDRTGRPRGE